MAERKPAAEEISVRRTEIMFPTAEGPAEAVIYVTYRAEGLPPGLVTIPKKDWTPETEAKLIREDLEKRRKAKPAVVRI